MKLEKCILITGVLGGIGKELAQEFYSNGYKVIGLDIRNEPSPNCHVFIQFDLNRYANEEAYRSEMNSLFDRKVPSLFGLINNAAVQILGGLSEIRAEDFQHTMNVNVTGPLLLSQYFLSRLEKENGSIVNIGSIHHTLTKKKFISYATSKTALIGLTKALAVDLEGRVRVNAISPAAIQTDMLLAGFDGNEAALEVLKKIHPVKRIGYGNDVARLVLFLVSENSGFIHGANISLDGGISSVLKDLE